VRRGLIVAVAGVAAFAAWAGVRDALRGYRSTRGTRVERFTLHSRLAHRNLHEILVVPRSGGGGGRRAPVVLLADGGNHSYWHDRRDGAWGSSVVRELIPAALRRTRADTHGVALGGISIGGFGALDLARLWPRAAVPALLQPSMRVVTVSRAWRSPRERSPSAP
jgi:hypothetical protein